MKRTYSALPKRSLHYTFFRMARTVLLCAIACAPAVRAQSQIGLLFPQGAPIEQNSGPSFMMGGAACGVSDDYNTMLRNPANLGFIDKTVFSSLYLFDFTRIGQGSDHTNFIQGYPDQISLGIPFGVFGTVGLSYNIESNAAVNSVPPPNPWASIRGR